MPDRRTGDRREENRKSITIKFSDAVKYLIIAVIFIILLSTNIVLAISNYNYKQTIKSLIGCDDCTTDYYYEDYLNTTNDASYIYGNNLDQYVYSYENSLNEYTADNIVE